MEKERPNTVAGLIDKRREIAGQVEHVQRQLRDLVADLDHVDATIRIFDPGADLGRAKRYPIAHAAFKGEMARFVLSALRQAKAPLSSLDIARGVMKGRGLAPDARTTVVIRKRVGASLWKLRAKGVVRDVPMEGEYKGWEIAR
jgi:hypothetical protein